MVRSLTFGGTFWFLILVSNPVLAQIQNVVTNDHTLIRPSYAEPKITAGWLASRAKAQNAGLARYSTYHDFQLIDTTVASGITFQHHAVDDAASSFQLAHYDHGSGLAAADIDGDGLADLYFVDQHGSNQLWRNLGAGRFENITAKAGVGLAGRVCVGASFADLDNDGRPDLLVTTVRMGNVLFRNKGGGVFEDISHASGLDYSGHSSGAVFFDYDNDGLLDCFVCNVGVFTANERGKDGAYKALPDAFRGHIFPERAEQSILYHNEGHFRFKDVSKPMQLEHKAWSGDASFADVNNDGFPDLYVLSMSGSDSLYENRGGRSFVNNTRQYFPKTPWGSMGLKFFDYDQNGRMDLYVTDMHSDMNPEQNNLGRGNTQLRFEKRSSEVWCSTGWNQDYLIQDRTNFIFGNALFRNNGSGAWEDRSDGISVETYWPWGVSVGDLNADGYEDMFVTSGMGYPFRYGINSLLLNEAGLTFCNAEFALGVEPRKRGSLVDYFTLGCSGLDKDNPLCEGRVGQQKVYASTSSRSSLLVDLDADGDLDLVINNMNDRPQVFLSNLSDRVPVNYLKLKLQGIRSNRDGLGTLVKVYSGERFLTQYNDGKSGYLSQSVLPLYFGLGQSSNISKIEILWPVGHLQTVKGPVAANRMITVTEPGSP